LGIFVPVLRLPTGAIAACAGLHAAGVPTIPVLRGTTAVNPEAAFGFLVGTYDGVIGWAALAWFGLLAAVYLRFSARSSR
ncbi:MAG: CPBP family intramembrane metalloprotease domain-containing protein, partial [Proteobacteria bacterium]